MKKFFQITVILTFILATKVAVAQLYRVENVAVEAERASALEAKEAALASGQLTAFKKLVFRLSSDNPTQLDGMTEEDVLPYVAGVSIEDEKTTATKYMGHITVEFNPAPVKAFLDTQRVGYLKTAAPSLLVIPEYIVNGKRLTLEDANPLYQALKEQSNFAPFYQAVVPQGTPEELNLLQQNSEEATALLPIYDKDKIMVLRLEFEDNDMWGIRSSFAPSLGMQSQEVYKRFRFNSGDKKIAAYQMASAVFKEMERRWRAERTTNTVADKKTLYLRVSVNSLSDWLALEKEMKTWGFFEDTTLKGLYLPNVLVEATYKNDEYQIRSLLLERGWILTPDSTGNGATLTRAIYNE